MKVKLVWQSRDVLPADILREMNIYSDEITREDKAEDSGLNAILVSIKKEGVVSALYLIDKIAGFIDKKTRVASVRNPEIILEEGDSLELAVKLIGWLFANYFQHKRCVRHEAKKLKQTQNIFASKLIGEVRKELLRLGL